MKLKHDFFTGKELHQHTVIIAFNNLLAPSHELWHIIPKLHCEVTRALLIVCENP